VALDHMNDVGVQILKFAHCAANRLEAFTGSKTVVSEAPEDPAEGPQGAGEHQVVDQNNTKGYNHIENQEGNGKIDQEIVFFDGRSTNLKFVAFPIFRIESGGQNAVRFLVLIVGHIDKL